MKAITLNSVVPMRTSPHEQAEMCSQVLFAETMTILKEEGAWAKIQLDADGYEGWVDRKMISALFHLLEQYIGTNILRYKKCRSYRML